MTTAVPEDVYLPYLAKLATPTPRPTNTPTRTPLPTATSSWTTLVNTTFEGDFPGPWQLSEFGDGNYMWAARTCRPYQGSYSGWSVGGGSDGSNLSCGSQYPKNAFTWMIYGPFSLVGATQGDLTFQLWQNVDDDEQDGVFWAASIDNYNYYGLANFRDVSDWSTKTLDLTDVYHLGNLMGQPQVWVGILFLSDENGHEPEGSYVDNVVLRKCSSGCVSQAPFAEMHQSTADQVMKWQRGGRQKP